VWGFISLYSKKSLHERKYSSVTFAYLDKVGKLDEIDHPNKVFNSLNQSFYLEIGVGVIFATFAFWRWSF
jgi:hypothetical protein